MTVHEAEAQAARVLASLSDLPVLPIDPMAIARNLGIRVEVVSLPSDVSGQIVMTSGDSPVISLNAYDSENRQRFTCAHEIGHYVRRSDNPGQDSFVDFRGTLAGLGVEPEEIFANQFAAALLMPAGRVKQFLDAGLGPDELASVFGTSRQAMELRLRNLRLA